ncbi:unnamed protein product [Ambrosiozyma monospora]|uniref:Unnamed protein product n=1 Tax=Ambrosiozyma monospora TaxID=43982 RepID=A0ACB5T786_AMBMO|nr:unnamed protein product [Ambrosiozyma monospora]
MSLISRALDLSILLAITYHLIISPYTKVEESFNIQATHDILFYGFEDTSKFDHIEFPGAVKRTFLGAILLATPLRPLAPYITSITDFLFPDDSIYRLTNLNFQIAARFLLGLYNYMGFLKLKNAVASACDRQSRSIGSWVSLFLLSQFHILYYSSRTLPNFIALPFVNYALSNVILGDIPTGLAILAFTGVVFRVEILIFTGILFVVCLANRLSKPFNAVFYTAIGGIFGAVFSLYVDSYFWSQQTLPELESFLFNVVNGNSSNWGTEPFHAYLTHYFKKLFIIPAIPLLAVPGFFIDLVNYKLRTIQTVSIASVLYVLAVSFLPHKEWRFIVYAIPGLIMSAASTIAYITKRPGLISKLFSYLVAGVLIVSSIMSLVFGYIFSYNYSGGEAISNLNIILNKEYSDNPLREPVTVHVDKIKIN